MQNRAIFWGKLWVNFFLCNATKFVNLSFPHCFPFVWIDTKLDDIFQFACKILWKWDYAMTWVSVLCIRHAKRARLWNLYMLTKIAAQGYLYLTFDCLLKEETLTFSIFHPYIDGDRITKLNFATFHLLLLPTRIEAYRQHQKSKNERKKWIFKLRKRKYLSI